MKIPADFLGFSCEKKILSRDCFQPQNTALIRLFQYLGPGVLRIGGHAVESTFWSAGDSGPLKAMANGKGYEPEEPVTLGPRSIDGLFGFAKESGWRVIYGLNLGANRPDMAAEEAAYALQAGGAAVLALEVGNEPNLFSRNGKSAKNDARDLKLLVLRDGKYTYERFRAEFEAYYRAIVAKSPHAPFAGPGTTKTCDWVPGFARDFKGRVALITSHTYPLSAKEEDPKSPRFASIENLLSTNIEEDWLPKLKAATAAGLPWRLGECNTASGGGKPGVSNVFVAALWCADFLFKVAERGGAGVNLHGGFTPGRYSPIYFLNGEYHPAPIYYGMLLFRQAAQGRVLPVDCQTLAKLTAHAVLGDDHKLRVVLINKDLTQPVRATIVAGPLHTKAHVVRLCAPSPTSAEGVTLAGSAIAKDGTWSPQPAEVVLCANGHYDVTLPLSSAAMVTIE